MTMRRTQWTAWMIAVLTTVLMQTGLYAQLPAPLPGDYGLHFGDVNQYNNRHFLDISDLHYLGVNREGKDEFLAVFVHSNYPDPIPDDPKYDPIQVVYFEYGGVPLQLRVRNVLTFRPRIADSVTPSYPLRAQLVYQPAGDDPRLQPAKWFLLATDSFLFELPGDFYRMTPAELAPRISGKYLAYSDDPSKPVFGMARSWYGIDTLPVGVARRDADGGISSILVGGGQLSPQYQPSPRLVVLDGNGNVTGAWELSAYITAEEPSFFIPPCGIATGSSLDGSGRVFLAVFGGGGGALNKGLFAPLPYVAGAPDEYALLFAGQGLDSGDQSDQTHDFAVLMRFGLNGQVRWARLYRHLGSSGNYIAVDNHGAFFVAVDDTNPRGLRLLFGWGYAPAFLAYVDAANGNPIWAYNARFLASSHSDTYGRFLDPADGQWRWVVSSNRVALSLDDTGILSVKRPYYCPTIGSPDCFDVGDRAFISTVMGNYLIFGDDWNRARGEPPNCANGFGWVPGLAFWDWTRQTLVPFSPDIERVGTCTSVPGNHRGTLEVYPRSVRNLIVERPATLEVRNFEYPLAVECKMDPCEGHVCPNGIGWSRGDVAPYEVNNPPYLLGDCCVDDTDLLAVLFNFGNEYNYTTQFKPGAGDVNCDEIVDDTDLLIVLFNFGEGCGG
jgi:hypothetical protein